MPYKKKEKKSLLLYYSYKEQFEMLDDEQLRKLLYAMIDFDKNGTEPKLDKMTKMAFLPIKRKLIDDKKAWEEICKKNSENAKKRWNANAYDGIQSHTSVSKRMRKYADIDKDKDNDNDNDIDVDNDIYSCSSITTTIINIYEYVEQNFGRALAPSEIQKIDTWTLQFDEDILKYAIDISVSNNKKNFSYVNGILNNWKSAGYKTIDEIKQNEQKPKKREFKNVDSDILNYDWLNDSNE